MKNRLQFPLLLPTVGFIVGCILFGALDSNLWTPLAILFASGVLSVFRGWRGLLLIMAISLGGVRISLEDSPKEPYSWSEDDSIFSKANEWAELRLSALHLSPRAQNLCQAMILGNREGIVRAQRSQYGYSGASHILAVSGLHISIIFLLVNILLLPLVLLPRGHIIRNILVLLIIWGYALMVGLSPSVLRSVIMFSVLQWAWAWGEPYSGVNALIFTLFAGVIVSPTILYSVGFQLSMVAVASIFVWGLPLYYRFFGGGGFIVSALCIGGACSVATMPIVSHTFGYIPLLGVAFNPLFILTSMVIISLGVVWIFMPLTPLDPIIRLGVESAAMLQERSVEWVASQEWGVVMWRASGAEVWIIYLIYITATVLIFSEGERG